MHEPFFQVPFPKGIMYQGRFYTVFSPLDRKAGTNEAALTLATSEGLEVELAKSSTTEEFQEFNFGMNPKAIGDYRRSLVERIEANIKIVTPNVVRAFAAEIAKSMRIFYEDARKVNSVSAARQKIFQKVADTIIETTVIKGGTTLNPKTHLLDPFANARGYSAVDVDPDMMTESIDNFDETEMRSSAIENFGDRAIKGSLSQLEEAAIHYLDLIREGKEAQYPNLESDFAHAVARTYVPKGETLVYFSWDTPRSVKIMRRGKRVPHEDDRPGDNHDISIRYPSGYCKNFTPVQELSKVEFNLAMRLMIESSIINSMPQINMDGVDFSGVESIFPVQLEDGSLDYAHTSQGKTMIANLNFPAYAVVDIHSPENVFLMDPGVIKFEFRLSAEQLTAQMCEYGVHKSDGKGHYDHFFISSGGATVCGYSALASKFRDDLDVEEDGDGQFAALSKALWENYHLLFSVLTDGLKHDSGYNHIDKMKSKRQGVEMVVDGHKFTSCYLPRAEVDAFNAGRPARKKLYIGDGRIK